jgi:hypothetical protein
VIRVGAFLGGEWQLGEQLFSHRLIEAANNIVAPVTSHQINELRFTRVAIFNSGF